MSLPLPLECPSQEADIEIQQNSVEVEIAAEINLLPQPEHQQTEEKITLDAEITITKLIESCVIAPFHFYAI